MLGELKEDEIIEMLENNTFGRLGCNDGKKTYVVPITYFFRGDHLLCYSRDGLKIEMMRKNPSVCFEVDDVEDYSNWRCIIAWGTYQEIKGEKDIEEATELFSEILLNMKASQTSLPPEATREEEHRVQKPAYYKTIIYRINLTEITGRFEKTL
jgi:nitroimidazol reductase NimA-like FMN-containing flavoprotein (pyridoxamine 5'-phosphate oxidase superfamily)